MFKSLPGFREFYPEDCSIRNHIFSVWRKTSRIFGLQEYDAPLLEPLELFTEKSGEEIVTQLFNFTDQGDRKVALRPEMTPSLARLVGAKANGMPKPIKWFNIAENFRYERPQKGRLRSFYQLNCDILGEPSTAADAEIIALLISSITAFGAQPGDFCVRLSDRDLWVFFLNSWGISDTDAVQAVLSIIDKMERESPEKTITNLSQHISDAEKFFEQAQKLSNIHSFNELKAYINTFDNKEALETRLADWELLIDALKGLNVFDDFVKIDLSIVRGLAYYTGFVFEAFQLKGTARALAGGGRYNNLVKKLGGPDLPAVGFAMGDVTLKDFLDTLNLTPKYFNHPEIFVAYADEASKKIALHDVSILRSANFRVEYPLKSQALNKQLKAANQLNAHFALIYKEDTPESNIVTLKNLQDSTEQTFPRDHLPQVLIDLR